MLENNKEIINYLAHLKIIISKITLLSHFKLFLILYMIQQLYLHKDEHLMGSFTMFSYLVLTDAIFYRYQTLSIQVYISNISHNKLSMFLYVHVFYLLLTLLYSPEGITIVLKFMAFIFTQNVIFLLLSYDFIYFIACSCIEIIGFKLVINLGLINIHSGEDFFMRAMFYQIFIILSILLLSVINVASHLLQRNNKSNQVFMNFLNSIDSAICLLDLGKLNDIERSAKINTKFIKTFNTDITVNGYLKSHDKMRPFFFEDVYIVPNSLEEKYNNDIKSNGDRKKTLKDKIFEAIKTKGNQININTEEKFTKIKNKKGYSTCNVLRKAEEETTNDESSSKEFLNGYLYSCLPEGDKQSLKALTREESLNEIFKYKLMHKGKLLMGKCYKNKDFIALIFTPLFEPTRSSPDLLSSESETPFINKPQINNLIHCNEVIINNTNVIASQIIDQSGNNNITTKNNQNIQNIIINQPGVSFNEVKIEDIISPSRKSLDNENLIDVKKTQNQKPNNENKITTPKRRNSLFKPFNKPENLYPFEEAFDMTKHIKEVDLVIEEHQLTPKMISESSSYDSGKNEILQEKSDSSGVNKCSVQNNDISHLISENIEHKLSAHTLNIFQHKSTKSPGGPMTPTNNKTCRFNEKTFEREKSRKELSESKQAEHKELIEKVELLEFKLKRSKDFMYMLVHDMRNPILSIEGYLEKIASITAYDINDNYDNFIKFIVNTRLIKDRKNSSDSSRLDHTLNYNTNSQPLSTRTLRRSSSCIENDILYGCGGIRSKYGSLNKNIFKKLAKRYPDVPANEDITSFDDVRMDDFKQYEEFKTAFKCCKSSCRIIKNLMEEILDQAKLENNTFKLFFENISLEEVMEDVVQIMEPQAKQRNLRLHSSISQDDAKYLKKIWGDSNRIRQVLLNLVSNSLKFTKEGYVKISAKIIHDTMTEDDCKMSLQAGQYIKDNSTIKIEIRIQDTGVGIRPEDLPNLFRNYSTLKDTENINKSGTGLGLSICKQLIEQMGGTIWAESKVGKGTDFILTINTQYNKVSFTENTRSKTISRATTQEQEKQKFTENLKKHISILLVDDMEFMRNATGLIIKRNGFKYDEAGDGYSALEKLQNQMHNIVLLDIQMPGMDGFETSIKIKEICSENKPYVVAMTGFDEDYLKDKLESSGFNCYASKPFDQKMFDKVIDKYIEWLQEEA